MSAALKKPTTLHVFLTSQKAQPTAAEQEFFLYLEKLIRDSATELLHPDLKLDIRQACLEPELPQTDKPVHNRFLGTKEEKKKAGLVPGNSSPVLALAHEIAQTPEGEEVDPDLLKQHAQRMGSSLNQLDRQISRIIAGANYDIQRSFLIFSPEDSRPVSSLAGEDDTTNAHLHLSTIAADLRLQHQIKGGLHQVFLGDTAANINFDTSTFINLDDVNAFTDGVLDKRVFNSIPRIVREQSRAMVHFVTNTLKKIAFDFRFNSKGSRLRHPITRKEFTDKIQQRKDFEALAAAAIPSKRLNGVFKRRSPVVEQKVVVETIAPAALIAKAFADVDSGKLDPLESYNINFRSVLGLPKLTSFMPSSKDLKNLVAALKTNSPQDVLSKQSTCARARLIVTALSLANNLKNKTCQLVRQAESFNLMLSRVLQPGLKSKRENLKLNGSYDDLMERLAKGSISVDTAHALIRAYGGGFVKPSSDWQASSQAKATLMRFKDSDKKQEFDFGDIDLQARADLLKMALELIANGVGAASTSLNFQLELNFHNLVKALRSDEVVNLDSVQKIKATRKLETTFMVPSSPKPRVKARASKPNPAATLAGKVIDPTQIETNEIPRFVRVHEEGTAATKDERIDSFRKLIFRMRLKKEVGIVGAARAYKRIFNKPGDEPLEGIALSRFCGLHGIELGPKIRKKKAAATDLFEVKPIEKADPRVLKVIKQRRRAGKQVNLRDFFYIMMQLDNKAYNTFDLRNMLHPSYQLDPINPEDFHSDELIKDTAERWRKKFGKLTLPDLRVIYLERYGELMSLVDIQQFAKAEAIEFVSVSKNSLEPHLQVFKSSLESVLKT